MILRRILRGRYSPLRKLRFGSAMDAVVLHPHPHQVSSRGFPSLLRPAISALAPNFLSKSYILSLDIRFRQMNSSQTLQSMLRTLFHSMPHLTRLSMHGTTSLFVLPASGYRLGETTDLMLPKLSEMLSIRTNFDDVPGSGCLTAFLNHRSNIGFEIKLITLGRSTISADRAARLRALGVWPVQS